MQHRKISTLHLQHSRQHRMHWYLFPVQKIRIRNQAQTDRTTSRLQAEMTEKAAELTAKVMELTEKATDPNEPAKAAQTGDTTPITAVAVLLVVSAALAGTVIYRKKRS